MAAQQAADLKNDRLTNRATQVLRATAAGGMAVVVAVILRWSTTFMRNREAPEQLLLRLYTTLGRQEAAAQLATTGLHPLAAKLMITAVALAVGLLGVWAIYWAANNLIAVLPFALRERIRPYIFTGPALLLLVTYLIYPAFNTAYTSLTEDILTVPEQLPAALQTAENAAEALVADAGNVTLQRYLLNGDTLEVALLRLAARNENDSDSFVLLLINGDRVTPFGLQNYRFAFTSPEMRIAFGNNILWLLIGTSGSVGLGLLIATLVDRIKREALAKSFIFLPMAISFVGASVIWRFVYAWQPPGRPQIGLLNALITRLGIEPIPWMIETPFNTYALIVIMIWLQTGFAMVVLSAALKGVPNEIVEAARIDGASELQLFFFVIIPMIRGSLITVSTAICFAILKVFDIVYVMTSGKFETEVIANRMFVEMFNFRNFGRASALAVTLLLLVVPIMVVNIRNLRRQGINQ